ncbi:3,4-dehydroadipyl-CoA semialdehyde dehydrogenase [uncultured Roseibium sp.]|uniref:3,4-dehydroadipyl-CoA semialdehyde dehydrogenase n=1 Tax=uncultured Roseibium sp. TaxID=1936171 RepID=UPI0032178E2A
MKLESLISGKWTAGAADGRPLVNPVTGETVAHADASGLDLAGAMDFAREKGGAALRAMSFAERGALLKAVADVLTENRAKYEEIARINSGNTKVDASIDIDGGIGTLKYYSRLGKSLGDATTVLEAGQDQLAKDPVFFSRHLWTSRPGVALQINAFNFPSWGMWEKIAAATIAGVPSMAKPATATAWLSHEMMRDVDAANVVPDGVFNLVCGNGEGLLDALGPMDSVAFTGSAETGSTIRSHPVVLGSGARLTIEADSVNATILGQDVAPGDPLFDLAVREVSKALSVKAGQLCTNIRRILVPAAHLDAFSEAVVATVSRFPVGDPADEAVRIGPLVNKLQQQDALEGIARLGSEARVLTGGGVPAGLDGAGAFVAPTLLSCSDPHGAELVHSVEVFGPCATVMPYDGIADGQKIAALGGGSLALSLFSNDDDVRLQTATSLGPWHGRIMMVDEETGRNHTGHSIVMPQCVHGGPGRAGGGEELGGLRGLRLHMQRSAIQASPSAFAVLAERAAEAAL